MTTLRTTITVPNYQDISVERDDNGTTYLYMGDNFVAFAPGQWDYFTNMLSSMFPANTWHLNCLDPANNVHAIDCPSNPQWKL